MRALRSGAGLPARRQPQPRTGPGAAGAAQLARSPPSEPAEVSGWLRGGKVWGGPCGFIGFWGKLTIPIKNRCIRSRKSHINGTFTIFMIRFLNPMRIA